MRGFIAPKNKGLDFWICREGSNHYITSLFSPNREPAFSLNSIIHLFMKRLGQSYESVLNMPTSDRDEIFSLEMKIIEQEKKQAEESNKK